MKNYRPGSHELFISDHEDILQISTICGVFEAIFSNAYQRDLLGMLGVAYVHEFSPTKDDQPWIRRGDWYSRGSIYCVTTGTTSRPAGMKFRPFPGVMQHQCCSIGYDPERDRQIFCHSCKVFFHHEELEHKENNIPDPLSRVIRGYGWEMQAKSRHGTGWSLVGNHHVRLDGNSDDDDHFAVTYTVTKEEEIQAVKEIRKILLGIQGCWTCKSCQRDL